MEEDKEINETPISCLSKNRAEIDQTAHLKKYLVWENKSNICWLDASMALIAHNKVMKRASQVSPRSKISSIIAGYAEAISIINNCDNKCSNLFVDRVNNAKSKLNLLQETTLEYLKPILKYKPGDPDSAFCSLYNLLKEDPVIKGIFDVTWISVKTCTNCASHVENTKTKPLITLSKVDFFDPLKPSVLYTCNCGKSEEIMKLKFVTLPPCLIFHFENGAGHEKPPLFFYTETKITQRRKYLLTGIMTLEKGQESNVNHFISWVREPFVDKWLDCNDLNPDLIYFTPDFPDIRFEDVSFYVYESFDDLGTIRDCKVVSIKNSEEDIPCIDISEESESENSNSASNASGPDKNDKKQEVSSTKSQDATFPAEKDSSKSQEEILSGDEEHIFDEKVIQSNSAHDSEAPCNEIKDAENDKNLTESIEATSPEQDKDIQDEEKAIDSGIQDLRISDDELGKDDTERVSQTEYVDESSLEVCKLDDQINTCYDKKQTDEDTVLTHEEKNLENTVAIEKKNDIEMKDDEQNEALLPVKKLHISDFGDSKPEDITKADFVKSGTSYVKLSFRKKKYPGLAFLRQKSVKNDNKPASDDTETTCIRKSPKSVEETKTSKRNRDAAWDTMPEKRPRKTQKVRQILEGLQSNTNKQDITHSMQKTDPRLSLPDKSKLKNNVGKKKILQKSTIPHLTSKDNKIPEEHNQVFTNRQTYSSMLPATESSNENDMDKKILKEFENVWTSHEPSCKCDLSSLDETIDTVVDFTFAYLCKLSQGLKKANSD